MLAAPTASTAREVKDTPERDCVGLPAAPRDVERIAPWLFGLRRARHVEGVPCASAHVGTITSRT